MVTAKKRPMALGVDVKELSKREGGTVKMGEPLSGTREVLRQGRCDQEGSCSRRHDPRSGSEGVGGSSGGCRVRPHDRRDWQAAEEAMDRLLHPGSRFLIKRIRPEIRAAVLQQFVKEGVIKRELEQELQLR